MGAELQYQLIINRVAQLQEEAANYRLAHEAQSARKAHQRAGHRRLRAAFGKLRTS